MTWQHRDWYSFVWICGDQMVEQHLHNIDVSQLVDGRASGEGMSRPAARRGGPATKSTATSSITSMPISFIPTACTCRATAASFRAGSYNQYFRTDRRHARAARNCKDMGEKGENPYVQEHIALVKSIRGQGPYINDGMTVAESTMTCIMARESAYSGRRSRGTR